MYPSSNQLHSSRSRAGGFVRGLALALIFTVAAPLLHAQIFTEIGDAGSTPAGAQNSGLIQPAAGGTASIFGTLTGGNDADIFRITLTNPFGFSASTVNTITGTSGGLGGLDTQLFLFDSAFHAIVANDDANGTTLQSQIRSGTSLLAFLPAGTYYLAISLSGNNPINLNNQLLFATGSGDTTAQRGMASGLSPSTLFDFNNSATFAQLGAYQINLISVPDTGSTLLLMFAAFGIVAVSRKYVIASSPSRS